MLLLQTRDVVVYRLVTCGTVEEKIYRKQVRGHLGPQVWACVDTGGTNRGCKGISSKEWKLGSLCVLIIVMHVLCVHACVCLMCAVL
jgi:hypothetical protein